jgi:hypothetical protein
VSADQRQLRKHGERRASQWCRKRLVDERVLQRATDVRRQLSKHLDAHRKRAAQAEGQPAAGKASSARAADGGTSGTDALRRALVQGYFANAARHEGGGHYSGVLRGSELKLHSNSTLYQAPPDWIVFHETTYTTVELVLSATKVSEQWLAELAPHFYQRKEGGPRRAADPTATMGDAAAADDARRDGAQAQSAKRAREPPDEAAPPASGRGGVAAMLGDSLIKGARLF